MKKRTIPGGKNVKVDARLPEERARIDALVAQSKGQVTQTDIARVALQEFLDKAERTGRITINVKPRRIDRGDLRIKAHDPSQEKAEGS